MGYYIEINGEFTIKSDQIEPAYQALIALDQRDDLKTSNSYGAGRHIPVFRWVSEDWVQSCSNLWEVFDTFRFWLAGQPDSDYVRYDAETDTYKIGFEFADKAGDELVVLAALAPFVESGEANYVGEDHYMMRLEYKDKQILTYEAQIEWVLINCDYLNAD